MDLEALSRRVQGLAAPPSSRGRPAAVVVPLVEVDGAWCLLFTLRTGSVAHHKGEVSFPGGAVDMDDGGPWAAALREIGEELGVLPDHLSLVGELSGVYVGASGFFIHPFLAMLDRMPNAIRSKREVAETFALGLHDLRQAQWVVRRRTSEGTVALRPEYRVGDRLVWGATARIVRQVLALTE